MHGRVFASGAPVGLRQGINIREGVTDIRESVKGSGNGGGGVGEELWGNLKRTCR